MNDKMLIWEAYQRSKTKKFISEKDYLDASKQFFSQRDDEVSKIILNASNYFEYRWFVSLLSIGVLKYTLNESSTFSQSEAKKEEAIYDDYQNFMHQFFVENGYDKWKVKVKTTEKKKYLSETGTFKLSDQFFSQRDDEESKLIFEAKNFPERQHRIQWLSEGSLKYHLIQRNVDHGGDPKEHQLFWEYKRFVNLFLMKNGYSGQK
jgi:hypothetical protein